MTHGRKAKTRVNPRSKRSGSLLTGFPEDGENSLESRVAKIEATIERMQEELDRASGAMPANIREALDSIGKKHRGPIKKIDDTELILNRNNLVTWLEEHWPQIAQRLMHRRCERRTLAAALEPIAKAPEIRSEWQRHFMDHLDVLLEFLRSTKFRRKPPKKTVADALALIRSERRDSAANRLPTRQIANAMAGVPKVRWRTSLDRCSKNPCSWQLGHNTASYCRQVFGVDE